MAGKHHNSKVYAIEPEKNNFEVLSKNIKLNNLDNVEVINMALGSKKGKTKLYLSKVISGGHSLIGASNNFEIVQLNTFDNLFKSKLDGVNLIKIDVEGFELEVLKGMKEFLSKKKIKNIILEIDESNYPIVEKFLKVKGYSLRWIMYNNYWAYPNPRNKNR